MNSFVIFTISNNRYAINLLHTWRIIQAKKLKRVPNSTKLIDGLLSFEESVIKVLNLRMVLKIEPFEEEVKHKLDTTKEFHKRFYKTISESIKSGEDFPFELNPNRCSVGQFIGQFNIPDIINDSFKEFKYIHSKFHNITVSILKESDKEKALDRVEKELTPLYKQLLSKFDSFKQDIDEISNHMQKYIIFRKGLKTFAIKVDAIVDIISVANSDIKVEDSESSVSSALSMNGVFESDEKLVTIIDDFSIRELE